MTPKHLKYLKFAIFLLLIGPQFSITFEKRVGDSETGEFISKAGHFSKESQFDSSTFFYQKAINIFLQSNDWDNYLSASRGIARNYIQTRDIQAALSVLLNAEKTIDEKGVTQCTERGSNCALLGYIYSIKGEYPAAIEIITKGITLDVQAFGKSHERVAADYYTLAVIYKSIGKFDEAIEKLDAALAIQELTFGKSSTQVSNTLLVMGSVYDEQNQFTKAISCYTKSLTILSQLGKENSADAATCHTYLMSSLNNIGDITGAVGEGKTAIRIYQSLSLSGHPNVASAYGKLGEIFTAVGDYEKAKEYLEQSLAIFTKNYPEKKSAIGTIYQLLSEVHKQTGDLSGALAYSLEGIHALETSSDSLHPQMGFMYELAAGVYADLKEYDKALQYYNKAVASREQVRETASRNDIAAMYTSIASMYTSKKQYALAESFLKKAEAIQHFSEEVNRPEFAETQKQFGILFIRSHRFERGLQAYRKALSILAGNAGVNDIYSIPEFSKSIYKREILDVLTLQSEAFESLYKRTHRLADLKASFAHYRHAMEMVDEVRRQFGTEMSKFHLAEQSKSIYGDACRIALELSRTTGDRAYDAQAFQIADRSKANVLLEKLFDGEAKNFAGIPDSLLRQEKELLKSIAFMETQLYKTESEKNETHSEMHGTLQSQIFSAKQQHRDLIDLFERRYPKYYQLKYSGYSLSVADAQRKLPAGTEMVEYLVADHASYVFLLSRDTLVVRTIPSPSTVDNAVTRFTSSLKKYETRDYVTSGYDLYTSLIVPVRKFIPHDSKVVIIPDGELFYLPFEALPTKRYPSATLPDFTAIDYLIKQNEISYSYSAEFYFKMSENSAEDNSTSSFIGFAPVFRDSTHNGDLLANRSYVEESGLSDVRSITLDGKKFNELKYSEEEIGAITHTFQQHSLPAREYLHTAATETNFKEFSKSYDIVHVATHGFINEKNPKFSAILFSQPSSSTADDDGILYVDETFNLDLKAKLVVLSSCESGIGKLVQGEGMIALTRGLFYAGAKNIMFSLWKVSDKQTYLLMDEFYKQMLNGKSYSASLREAKLRLISSKESAFPSKWSGFVLVGE